MNALHRWHEYGEPFHFGDPWQAIDLICDGENLTVEHDGLAIAIKGRHEASWTPLAKGYLVSGDLEEGTLMIDVPDED